MITLALQDIQEQFWTLSIEPKCDKANAKGQELVLRVLMLTNVAVEIRVIQKWCDGLEFLEDLGWIGKVSDWVDREAFMVGDGCNEFGSRPSVHGSGDDRFGNPWDTSSCTRARAASDVLKGGEERVFCGGHGSKCVCVCLCVYVYVEVKERSAR